MNKKLSFELGKSGRADTMWLSAFTASGSNYSI